MSKRPAAVNVPVGPSNESRVTVASMQADGGVGRSCLAVVPCELKGSTLTVCRAGRAASKSNKSGLCASR
jgi:hypothetical protein